MIKKFEEFIKESITSKIGVYKTVSEIPADFRFLLVSYFSNEDGNQYFEGFFNCDKLTIKQLKKCWENSVNSVFEIGPDDTTNITLMKIPYAFFNDNIELFKSIDAGEGEDVENLWNVVEDEIKKGTYEGLEVIMSINGSEHLDYYDEDTDKRTPWVSPTFTI